MEVPVGDIEEIVALPIDANGMHRPDRAFVRYGVVLQMRSGDQLLAIPMRLGARDAFAIANDDDRGDIATASR